MQFKTPMRYHFTWVRMAIIKKSTNKNYWKGCGEKRTLVHGKWECKWVQLLCKQCAGFSKQQQLYRTTEQFHFWVFIQKK